MGAADFRNEGTGTDAKAVFTALVDEAQYLHGHGGYTGTIAEKYSFVEFQVPAGVDPKTFIRWIEGGDDNPPAEHAMLVLRAQEVYNDKWGPAVCVRVADDRWAFFGWASD